MSFNTLRILFSCCMVEVITTKQTKIKYNKNKTKKNKTVNDHCTSTILQVIKIRLELLHSN